MNMIGWQERHGVPDWRRVAPRQEQQRRSDQAPPLQLKRRSTHCFSGAYKHLRKRRSGSSGHGRRTEEARRVRRDNREEGW